jgi:hypothetical protein
MTVAELNALPHGTVAELNAIPSVTLKAAAGLPAFLIGTKTRVFDAVETPDGWDGCQRDPRLGDFQARKLFARGTYELA